MKIRIMKHQKNENVWFTVERQFLFFFWRSCFWNYDEPAKYNDIETAKVKVEQYRRIKAKVKSERVITL